MAYQYSQNCYDFCLLHNYETVYACSWGPVWLGTVIDRGPVWWGPVLPGAASIMTTTVDKALLKEEAVGDKLLKRSLST